MTELIPGDTTKQGTSNQTFDDDDRRNPVAQVETDGGVRNTRMEMAPGFYTAPVPGERVHSIEEDGVLYGIGGTNADALASLQPTQGDRGCYAVDGNGEIVAHLRLRGDGSFLLTTENADITIEPSGLVSINGGNLTVDP